MNMHTRLETKGAGDDLGEADLETLQKAFVGYHTEATTGFAAVAKLTKRLDDMEAKGNRTALGFGSETGGSNPATVAEHKAAFAKFARTGREEELKSVALSTDNDPAGGFLIPEEVSKTILAYQVLKSPIRNLARVITMGSSEFKQPFNKRGTNSGWVAERESRPQTLASDLAELIVPANEVYAEPAATQTLLDDAFIDVAAWMADEIAVAFDKNENSAFVVGDGIKKPTGFLSYPIVSGLDATRAFGSWEYVPTGQSGDFATSNPGDALIDLVYRVAAPYRANGAWAMNSLTASRIAKMKDGQGNYLWKQSRDFANGEPNTLLGYPVQIIEDMPDIAANSTPIAFGDWKSGYLIADRIGMRILRDPYTAKPYVLFYATKRVGGLPLDTRAIKLLKMAAS